MSIKNLDKSLSFGIQNFFFCESDETGVTYNYYGFATKKGSVLIMRTDKTASSAKYYIEVGEFATIFAAKDAKTYVYPYELVDPSV